MHELHLSILTINETKRTVLRLAAGAWAGHEFAVTPSVCNEPTCDCTNVRFVRSNQAPENEVEPFGYFSLDARGHCASALPGSHSSPLARQFAEAMAAELTDSDWNDLLGYVILSKQLIIEEADSLTMDIGGIQDMLADTEHLLGYSDVFPLAVGLPFMLGAEHWRAQDEYCIDSECKCHDALLTFTRLDIPRTPDEPEPAVYYDYDTFLATPEDPPAPGQPALGLLVSELIRSANGLPILLKYRHTQLRILSLRAQIQANKKRIQSAENRAHADDHKIGRNDPCPCGSGKKFKKCCGLPGANGV